MHACVLSNLGCVRVLSIKVVQVHVISKLCTSSPVNTTVRVSHLPPLLAFRGFDIDFVDSTHGTIDNCSFQITSHVGGGSLIKAREQ